MGIVFGFDEVLNRLMICFDILKVYLARTKKWNTIFVLRDGLASSLIIFIIIINIILLNIFLLYMLILKNELKT